MTELTHVECARETEALAADLDVDRGAHRNWFVTMQFYAILHYLEEVLSNHGYASVDHGDRSQNIKACDYVDDRLYSIYRSCYDLSRQARYECVRMDEDAVATVRERVREGKSLLGFRGGASNYKYSTK